jgi:branched-subunit amino acid ABC-type transport system permease component
MGSFVGFEFHSGVLGPGIVLGIAAAGLYGVLAVSLVLTYRVSRTIGFVQGGIALLGTYLYWWLTFDTGGNILLLSKPRMGRLAGMVIVVLVGAVIGLVYGATVTGKRLANWPRLNLTTYSLAWFLLLAGVVTSTFEAQDQRLPSVFGTRTYTLFGSVVTSHQVATILFLGGFVAVLGFVLARTQTGIYVRAIADDVQASRLVGVSLSGVGTGVYAVSGALSAFAGVLLSTTVGTSVFTVILVFLRALTVCILGGMNSFALAMAGCLVLGVGESAMQAGVFGPVAPGMREFVIVSVLFVIVLLINRVRPVRVLEATGL